MHLHGPLDHDRRNFLVADPHCFQSLRFGDAHLSRVMHLLVRVTHSSVGARDGLVTFKL